MPDASKMSDTEKMMWYQNEKKSPALAVFFNTILPTAGYAYAGDWERGIKFKGAEIGTFIVAFILDEAFYPNPMVFPVVVTLSHLPTRVATLISFGARSKM